MTISAKQDKTARVLDAVKRHPGGSTFTIAYKARLNTPGPMGGDGRSEALGILSILMTEGRVTRELRGDLYHWTAVDEAALERADDEAREAAEEPIPSFDPGAPDGGYASAKRVEAWEAEQSGQAS